MKYRTRTVEYDDEGRVVREIEVEYEWPQPYVLDSGRWWQPNPQPWWQNPVISFTANTDALVWN